MLFVQEHQMSEDWSNMFLNCIRLRQIMAGFKWESPLRSLLFPLQVQFCYLQLHGLQPLLWITCFGFSQSVNFYFRAQLQFSFYSRSFHSSQGNKSLSLIHIVLKRKPERNHSKYVNLQKTILSSSSGIFNLLGCLSICYSSTAIFSFSEQRHLIKK